MSLVESILMFWALLIHDLAISQLASCLCGSKPEAGRGMAVGSL